MPPCQCMQPSSCPTRCSRQEGLPAAALRGGPGPSYEVESGFSLHQMRNTVPVTAELRLHVEHFRGQLGDHFDALIDESGPSP